MPRIPVQTPLGTLHGRDCIFLDSVTFENGTSTLVLRGSINANLCEWASEDDPSYVLRFTGVLALRLLELDSWHDDRASSFDEVVDSPWLAQLGGKVQHHHRHVVIQTYDDVFDVVCEHWEFIVVNTTNST